MSPERSDGYRQVRQTQPLNGDSISVVVTCCRGRSVAEFGLQHGDDDPFFLIEKSNITLTNATTGAYIDPSAVAEVAATLNAAQGLEGKATRRQIGADEKAHITCRTCGRREQLRAPAVRQRMRVAWRQWGAGRRRERSRITMNDFMALAAGAPPDSAGTV